jgi:hypothetical protein
MSNDPTHEFLTNIRRDLGNIQFKIDRHLKQNETTTNRPHKCRECKNLGFTTAQLLADHRSHIHGEDAA